MAGEWIKMRGSLLTNPKVIRMARTLLLNTAFVNWYGRHVTRNEMPKTGVTVNNDTAISVVTRVTVGALLPIWFSVNDCASDDGVMVGAGLCDLDTIAGVPGIGTALESVGWIEVLPNEEGILFPNFNEYNTVGKQRSGGVKTNAERQAAFRERRRNESNAQKCVTFSLQSNHREEKNREEKKTPKVPKGTAVRFEDFWNAWPKGDRKQDRIKCLEKWTKESLDLLVEKILADISVKTNSEKWREGFVEAPLVYLNNRRWEDGAEAGVAQQESFV